MIIKTDEKSNKFICDFFAIRLFFSRNSLALQKILDSY